MNEATNLHRMHKEGNASMLPDDGSRFRAPARMAPQCTVSACDRDAYAQIDQFGNTLEVRLCAEHYCRFYLVVLLFLGDAHAQKKWKALVATVADEVGRSAPDERTGGSAAQGVLGVGPGTLPAVAVCEPSEWRCARCGGGMSGSWAVGSWSHRCRTGEG